jgi:predicted PurR-regulated permease PerM
MALQPGSSLRAPIDSPIPPRANPMTVTVLGVIVVLGLYFGQDVLKPLALAVLLAFALAPVVVRLRRLGLGRIGSAGITVLLVSALLGGLALVVTSQLLDLAEKLPTYEYNLLNKIRGLRQAAPSGGVVDKTLSTIHDLNKELQDTGPAPGAPAARTMGSGEAPVQKPVPVEVHEPEESPIETVIGFAGPLIGPIATAGVVIVFVIFMLVQREDLRDRAIRLLGARDLTRATQAMNDAARRVSRYLLMQLIINVCYGVPIGVGLYFIGVPNPLLWGLLATILRFVPYLGPIISAAFPLALSLAVDPGWTMTFLTLGLVVGLELFSNNVLEPWLYGSSTGLSPVAILVAAVLWTALWGPVGLLLATPLTVCLVVLGQHVPQLQFLDILLGDRPPLAPAARLYQRLLAGDTHEATELVEEYAEAEGPERCCENILLPALVLAERDRERGVLVRDMQQVVAEGVSALAELAVEIEAVETGATDPATAEADEADAVEEVPAAPLKLLCLGARNDLDTAAAAVLARLLRLEGLEAQVLAHIAATPLTLQRLRREGVDLICLSYCGPAAPSYTRRLARRVRSHLGQKVPLIVSLWGDDSSTPEIAEAVGAGADAVLTTLPLTLTEIRRRIQPDRAVEPASVPDAGRAADGEAGDAVASPA